MFLVTAEVAVEAGALDRRLGGDMQLPDCRRRSAAASCARSVRRTFTDDEDVDESVSRYMQHLLSRSPQPQDGKRDRYIPVPTEKRSAVGAAAGAKPLSKVATFMLSAGLLYWGYYYRPGFMILGILTSGLGVVTWLDLLLAIRQAHVRASRLTGRKKASDKAKS